MLHGSFRAENGSFPLGEAVFGFAKATSLDRNYLLRGIFTSLLNSMILNITRLPQGPRLAVVATTPPLVDIVLPRPDLLGVLVFVEPAGTVELATCRDGSVRMSGFHRRQARKCLLA
jgi:hypothetical protein